MCLNTIHKALLEFGLSEEQAQAICKEAKAVRTANPDPMKEYYDTLERVFVGNNDDEYANDMNNIGMENTI